MRVIPTQPTTQTKQRKPKQKPTERPTFAEWLLLALANGKERN